MNRQQDRNFSLPLKGNLSLIYLFSLLIAILMGIVSIAGLLFRSSIYPTDDLVRAFVPNDITNLLIGLPILLGSMALAWRSKLLGLLFWTGALFFVFYICIAYVFTLPFSWVFPLYLCLIILSVYTLIALVAHIDGNVVQQILSNAVPVKLSGGVLAGLGSLLFLRVIVVIIQVLSSGAMLTKTELAVHVADFLITPAWVIGGILLWRRKALGYVAGLGLLFQGSMLFVALIIYLLVQPFLTGASFAWVDVIVVFLMGLVCFVPLGLFVRAVMRITYPQAGQ